MTEDERYAQARRKVAEIKGFYIHAAIFVLVMTILIIVDVAIDGWRWAHWPLIGWGTGLLAHAALVFGGSFEALRGWEERKARELMDKTPR